MMLITLWCQIEFNHGGLGSACASDGVPDSRQGTPEVEWVSLGLRSQHVRQPKPGRQTRQGTKRIDGVWLCSNIANVHLVAV